METTSLPSPFNTPFETGVRALYILAASYPTKMDLQRLIDMDYLVVHSADAGGPKSLHAPLPLRGGELLVRRGLVEHGLELMVSRRLVERSFSEDGICYLATDLAAPFLECLTARYALELQERAHWAVEFYSDYNRDDLAAVTRGLVDAWSAEFAELHSRLQ